MKTVVIDLLPEYKIIVPDDIPGIVTFGKFEPALQSLGYLGVLSRAQNLVSIISKVLENDTISLVVQAEECWQATGIVLSLFSGLRIMPRVLLMKGNGDVVDLNDFIVKEVVVQEQDMQSTNKVDSTQTT